MRGYTSWRIAPLLLFAFFIFLAQTTARDVAHPDLARQQESQSASESTRWHGGKQKAGTGNEQEQNELAESVKEATALLRKVKPPVVSKLASYTRKPKGFLGSSAYYAKEAFVLLFMGTPQQANLMTTSTSTSSQAKLPPPLSRAVKLLEEAAQAAEPDAMFLLAEMNFHGNFTHPISYQQAFKYYKQLADLEGNSTAQHMLGFMYATGLNPEVPSDQAKSMLYHTFAAEQDNTRSQMTLAYRHHAGIATPRNCDEAVQWYKEVADKAILYYRSGPPGGHVLSKDSYSLANDVGGVYGEGASVSSAGVHAKQGGVTSDAYADVDDVLEYLHLQSSKKDLKATFGLARLHYDGGRGMKRDLRAAKGYFMQVAREYWSENGKTKKDVPNGTEKLASKAAGYLGRMFLRGEGMEQSFSKAKIWFTRGLANGDALCQYSLGLMHMEGLGVPQDTAKAADFFAAAADQDLAVAQTNLGMLFLDQGDVTTATRYFELAARNSHIEAFYYLAELNNQGIGRDRSCGMASAYYKIVVEKAEAVWASMSEAYEAFEDGDTQKAIVTYLMAAEQGSEMAQANVAFLLDHTKPKWSPLAWIVSQSRSAKTAVGDAALALIYWTRSAKQQNIDSLVKMGDYYLSGLGTLASPENAAACYQAAAETLQSAQAMWNLGWMHENGIGIDQDFHLAKRFYDQALETNREAYLPVKISLFMLRWRSWWNDITNGGVKSMGSDDAPAKRRTFAEWLNDFLEADAQMNALEYEADDWGNEEERMMGSDEEFWGGDDIDDGLIETMLIGGLLAALGWLVWYRQQQQRRAAEEQRRREGVEGGQADAAPPAVGQQPDGGFFPQPGDPNWGAWVAGGAGH
ncbi:ERAD-associated protein [Elasticomyces elasticus]|nr:ERAD-associated protein [Elasticomyces elasticus]